MLLGGPFCSACEGICVKVSVLPGRHACNASGCVHCVRMRALCQDACIVSGCVHCVRMRALCQDACIVSGCVHCVRKAHMPCVPRLHGLCQGCVQCIRDACIVPGKRAFCQGCSCMHCASLRALCQDCMHHASLIEAANPICLWLLLLCALLVEHSTRYMWITYSWDIC
jgi:hypothetical protein